MNKISQYKYVIPLSGQSAHKLKRICSYPLNERRLQDLRRIRDIEHSGEIIQNLEGHFISLFQFSKHLRALGQSIR